MEDTEPLADWELELLGEPAPYHTEAQAKDVVLEVGDTVKLTGEGWAGIEGAQNASATVEEVERYKYLIRIDHADKEVLLNRVTVNEGFEITPLIWKSDPEDVGPGATVRLVGRGWTKYGLKIGESYYVYGDGTIVSEGGQHYHAKTYATVLAFELSVTKPAQPERKLYETPWRIEIDISGEGSDEASTLMLEHILNLVESLDLPAKVRRTKI